jgi:HEPN domain-containing protein
MTKEEHIKYWITSAESDLEVAETLLFSKKNLWCLFITHLVIEKCLKALYVNVFNQVPPKIHNLLFLVEKTELELEESQIVLLDRLNLFQISARYPDYKNNVNQFCTDEFTVDIFQKSKEFFQWIKSLLK